MKEFYVYILFNQSRTLYIGVTNDLIRRMDEHRRKLVRGFTAKYNITQLAYYETYPSARSAIEREKQLKGWKRERKVALIEAKNPRWEDLNLSLRERSPQNPQPPQPLRETIDTSDPSQILRCAQNDTLGKANAPSTREQILRCAQDDALRRLSSPSCENRS
jgi:putative endonuclease